ncbi:ABC transporter B family member 6 [Hondaea fermentalgiana]|uniref:ABC transporter B family member 6 n=1 Tax=Hondaea fermentalgiana TaxID=2315210 RepID=A0A2R5GS95_9STRA|nr:ABC transporter B family member 6 [Hondaea fermentalgiana]|eukprot:GBG33465.1 ABC transporter B family member 6 [Hondaea fermentalgiana]
MPNTDERSAEGTSSLGSEREDTEKGDRDKVSKVVLDVPNSRQLGRAIWVSMTIANLGAISFKWLVAVVLRKLFIWVEDKFSQSGGLLDLTASEFWDFIFLTKLDLFDTLWLSFAVAIPTAFCSILLLALPVRLASATARARRELLLDISLSEGGLLSESEVSASFVLEQIAVIFEYEANTQYLRAGEKQCVDSVLDVLRAADVVAMHNKETKEKQVLQAQETHPGVDEPAVQNVSFTIPQGLTMAVVAESGGGKSTLFRAASSLVQHEGWIYYGSVVLETPPDDSKIWAILEQVGLAKWVESRKQGLDTVLATERMVSGGQAQRLQIARLLCREGLEYVLLDECMSALDPAMRATVTLALRAFLQNKTVLVITHSHDTVADLCDEVLDLGKLQSGDSEPVVPTGEYLARLEFAPANDADTEAK